MNFDFSEDQKLLKQTARNYLDANCPLSVCREVLQSEALYSEEIWRGVADLGWLGAAIPEEYGGVGLSGLDLAVISEEVGRALAPIPLLSSTYLATEALLLAGSENQKERWLPKLATGEAIGCFAFSERPGQQGFSNITTRYSKGALTGTKTPVIDGEAATFAIVVARSESGVTLALANLETAQRKAVKAIDPSRPLAQIRFEGTPAEVLGDEGMGEALAAKIFNRAAVLLAFEQLGGAERALEMTLDYTRDRYAFGRPIASYQALKHRMADHWCDIELARSNSWYGAWALTADSAELEMAACLSRVAASDAFDQTAVDMVQMHGGVGVTWEYDCHLFYRRAKLLSLALGASSYWRELLVSRYESSAAIHQLDAKEVA